MFYFCLCCYSCTSFSPFTLLHPAQPPLQQSIRRLLTMSMKPSCMFFDWSLHPLSERPHLPQRRSLASLAIRDMHVKTTMRHHLTLAKWPSLIHPQTSSGKDEDNPTALLVGMQTGAATVENSMEFPQKIKNGTAFWPSNSTTGNIP